MRLGRTGGVLYPANAGRDRGCTVKRGTPVFVNGLSSWCDNAIPGDFYGVDEAAQRACALAWDETVAASLVSIDGGSAVDVRDPRYGVFSPQRRVKLPPENILEIPPPPRPITFTVHGWMAMIVDLPLGLHAIRSDNTFVDGSEPYIFTKYVNVVRR